MSAEYARKLRLDRKQQNRPIQRGGETIRKAGNFIFWDGEGADFGSNLDHRYIMLCWHSTNGDYGTLRDPDGLDFARCMEYIFLIASQKVHKNFIHVFFAGQYDNTMILRDILPTRNHLIEFFNIVKKRHPEDKKYFTTTADTDEYRIRYDIRHIPRKETQITRYRNPITEYPGHNLEKRTVQIWDVWGFFQSSFVNTLKEWLKADNPSSPYHADYTMISTQKARRGKFDASEIDEIETYCLKECQLGCLVMTALYTALQNVNLQLEYNGETFTINGLSISRWDGVGAIATALAKHFHIKDHMNQNLPDFVHHAACYASAGGRSELIQFGTHQSTVYQYDIRSAYPSVMATLPSFAPGAGTWHDEKTVTPDHFDRYGFIRVTWEFNRDHSPSFFPFMHRDKQGICYPSVGQNWVTTPEVAAYERNKKLYKKAKVTYSRVVWYEPTTNYKPWWFIPHLYAIRADWKASGNGAQIILKLGPNAFNGKMTQNDGAVKGEPPPLFQIEWGSHVTGAVRAKIFDAMCLNPSAIISVQTDGIFSTEPLPLPLSTALGDWEYTEHTHMVIPMAGMYWSNSVAKHRGISTDFIAETGFDGDTIRDAYRNGIEKLDVTARRTFLSFGHGVMSETYYENIGTWKDGSKTLNLSRPSAKRVGQKMYNLTRLADELTHTRSFNQQEAYPGPSAPYVPEFALPNDPRYAPLMKRRTTAGMPSVDSYALTRQIARDETEM